MIRIEGLVKRYGDVVAVAGLDLAASPGEVLALLGPNGAGKSTTVQCVVGLLDPDEGRVLVGGHDVRADPVAARRALSYVPEIARIYDALTPTEYLQLKGRLFDLGDEAIEAASCRLLDGFGLLDRRHEPMAAFSKGMTQKVSLAAALLTNPAVLVLDEPLSGLDVETTMVVKELIRGFATRGGTVLYCSHMLDVVETLADRVAVIDRGQLQAVGTMDELRGRAGAAADTRLESVFAQLTEAGDPIRTAARILGSDDA